MSCINVIGLGYIGLPTALMLAKSGLRVVGTDLNKDLVNSLKEQKLTFNEPYIREVFDEAITNGIEFVTEYIRADVYIVAVPTPYQKETKKIDAGYVISAVNKIIEVCANNAIIIIESTVSPGTIDKYVRPIIETKNAGLHLVHAPERIIPGNMIHELENNSRTVGVDDFNIGQKVKNIYSKFCKSEIVITDIRSAEMSKVVENTYRDVNIAFANELAKICRMDNMDVYEIIKIANKHPRVNILQPGPGVGGHCISVDPWFLVGDYPDLTNLILAARKINESMPKHVLGRIRDIMRENKISDISRIGLYGLTYKEDVDDIRESPTLQILDRMSEHLASGIKVYDPLISCEVVENQFLDFSDFLNQIDIIVILVAHTHIKQNYNLIENKIILDTKNTFSADTIYKI
jgi:UDP-N-acetyl-D-mannosaminuronic acid dehydrogenase